MDTNYTDITVILDRSGSMSSVRKDMEGGLNQFFDDQKKVPGRCVASLFQFDTEHDVVFSGMNISDVPKVELVPRGGTALLDAIGRTLAVLGERFKAMPEHERPGKVIVIIVTDGQENSSLEFRLDAIKKAIETQRDTYKWEFVFLGANQDAIQEAAQLGVVGANAMTYAANSGGIHNAYASLDSNVTRCRVEPKQSMSFSTAQRQEQAEYLKQK